MNATRLSSTGALPPQRQADIREVLVSASSRLHFGLFSWGGEGRQFGGVGVMVREPGLTLCARPAAAFSAEGVGSERIVQFCDHWARFRGLDERPALHWQVMRPPVEHVGLGSGTQLALSVAAALYQFHDPDRPATQELALSVGRGLRSAIGAHGFHLGGLIVEPGKLPDERLSPLGQRTALPADWRVVLVRPQVECGLHGAAEKNAFAALPIVPAEVSRQLRILAERLVTSASDADFADFSQTLWDYGTLAGSCFTPVQGGPFNGPVLTRLVERLRSIGAVGVGQSSWGPTLFAFQPHEIAAHQLVRDLRAAADMPLDIIVASLDNEGARINARRA